MGLGTPRDPILSDEGTGIVADVGAVIDAQIPLLTGLMVTLAGLLAMARAAERHPDPTRRRSPSDR